MLAFALFSALWEKRELGNQAMPELVSFNPVNPDTDKGIHYCIRPLGAMCSWVVFLGLFLGFRGGHEDIVT